MKFSVSRKDFSETLSIVSGATAKDKTNPILNCIYLKATSSILELQSNSRNLGIVSKIPCNAEEEGEVLLDAKTLMEFVKKIVGEVVTVSINKEANAPIVKISDSKTSFTMLTMQPDTFPKVDTIEDANGFTMSASVFKSLINNTAFAAGTDEARPIFSGCLFHITKHSDDGFPSIVRMVATNTHRIAVSWESDGHIDIDLDLNCIIPAQQLIELSKRLGDGNIQITPSKRNISFTFDNLMFVFRLIQGEFPDYTKVVDKSWSSRLTIDAAEFLDVVQRVALVAKKTEYGTIKFNMQIMKLKFLLAAWTD